MLAAITAGKHIVLEFGTHNDMLSYLLVANILTRSIRQHYVDQKERYMATKDPAAQPRPLMITVEEAHKFLDPSVARDTTFGILAREMRKYDVTLLVVDQRPSAIDSEVLSQIGTRIVCLLDDEKDVDAILSGVSGASRLRGILATLETRGQAMLLGHALPMPVTIRTREYDDTFWAEMRGYGDERSRLADVDRKMARFARL
jgi:DNA helicase HerA-like ATPase